MKTFYFGGPTWMFMTPDQMHEEHGRLRAAHKYYQNADIYFLTKMRKVRFNPAKSYVTSDGRIQVEVVLGDPNGRHERRTIAFPATEVLYSMAHIREQFKSRQHFFYYCLTHIYKPLCKSARLAYGLGEALSRNSFLGDTGLRLMQWAYGRDVCVKHKNSYEITIFDPIAKQITDSELVEKNRAANPEKFEKKISLLNANWDSERLKQVDFEKISGQRQQGNITLTIDQVINSFEIDVGAQEVLYIGKTNREPFERLLPHEQLQKLEAEFLRNDEEALVVHLLGFKKLDISPEFIGESKLPSTVMTSLVEAELINYFKPTKNTTYVADSGKSEWDHVKALISEGYDAIAGELDFDGNQYTKYYSQVSRGTTLAGHEVRVDLSKYRKNLRRKKSSHLNSLG